MNLIAYCDAVADAVLAHPDFWDGQPVPVLNAWRGDHLKRLESAAARLEIGAVVTVQQLAAVEGGQAGVVHPLTVRVLIAENLTLNRSGKHVDQLALAAAGMLVGLTYPGAETSLEFLGITPVAATEWPAPLPEGSFLALAAVDLSCAVRLPDAPYTTPTPTLALVDGRVVISGATGSALFYTLDESTPTRDSQPYTVSLRLAAGTVVTARAWRTGQVASLEASLAT